jgi:hypothetical protein
MDEPFDVMSMDMWHPGTTLTTTTTTRNQKAILTMSLCNLTGFVGLAFVLSICSCTMTRLAFSHFFVPNGLPKLVIVDGGSEFKGVLIAMCDQLGTSCYLAPPKAHNSILCKRFHRHLDKVQWIEATRMEWIASRWHKCHSIVCSKGKDFSFSSGLARCCLSHKDMSSNKVKLQSSMSRQCSHCGLDKHRIVDSGHRSDESNRTGTLETSRCYDPTKQTRP